MGADERVRNGLDSGVLSVDDLARALNVDRKTAYKAVRRGEIPGVVYVGRCIRVSRQAIDIWLAEISPSKS